jgi:hypothetical protein
MVAIFLFSRPSHYTKNTYLTFLNHTTPRFSLRDRVNVNFRNKPDGSGEKTFTLASFIHLSSICVHLRLSAVSKKRLNYSKKNFFTQKYKKKRLFFPPP